jgi:hypothetical protein
METTIIRKRKSEALAPKEQESFKEYVDSFSTKLDCMEALGITMPTLDRILFKGSGRPDTIKKIREALNK